MKTNKNSKFTVKITALFILVLTVSMMFFAACTASSDDAVQPTVNPDATELPKLTPITLATSVPTDEPAED